MPYCPQCGNVIAEGSRFCSSCGCQLAVTASTVSVPVTVQPAQAVPYVTPVTTVQTTAATLNDYRVVLVSIGSCKKSNADDLLEDILGYTNSDAKVIINNLPMEIAHSLTITQAQYIAQALTEYGMQVSVCNTQGYVDLGVNQLTSVYNNDGSFVSSMLSVLATINAVNRVRNFNRWTYNDPYRYVYAPRYVAPRPPMHMRRPRVVAPPPPPAPRPYVGPRGSGPRPGGPVAPGRPASPRSGGPGRGPAGPGRGSGRGPGRGW